MNLKKLMLGQKKLGRKPVKVPASKVFVSKTVMTPRGEDAALLVIRGRVLPSEQQDDEEYTCYFAFPFRTVKGDDSALTVKDKAGKQHKARKPTFLTPCRVYCSCTDYQMTWYLSNSKNDAVFGPKVKLYKSKGLRSPRNPKMIPGLCKHLTAVAGALTKKDWISDATS